MSWQAYIDNNLVSSGKIHSAAIYAHDGSIWAISPSISLSTEALLSLVNAFDNASDVRSNGLHVAGRRFIVFRSDNRSIYGKSEKDGVVAVKTGLTVLLAFYNDPVQAGEATKVVEELADYLLSVGF